jgi:hypothetical protein
MHRPERMFTLNDIGSFELSPSPMTDGENEYQSPRLVSLINDAINVRLLAVKHVPQRSLCARTLRNQRTATGAQFEGVNGLLQIVVPPGCRM